MTNALEDYRASMAAKLRNLEGLPAGVSVTLNPAAGPPAILVDLVIGLQPSGIGAWACEIPVKCFVPPPGDASAARLLEVMVLHCLAALGWAPFSPGTYRPTVDIEVPMYTLLYPAQIPNPRC